MSTILQAFMTAAGECVKAFDAFVHSRNIGNFSSSTYADHICYKCGSRPTFEGLRAMFESQGCLMYQSVISGRYIAYIKLKSPIATSLGPVRWVELSDQKPDGSQKDGFDHIEVYTVGSSEKLIARLSAGGKVEKIVRPHHTTVDAEMGGYIFRVSDGPLLDKIKSEEFV